MIRTFKFSLASIIILSAGVFFFSPYTAHADHLIGWFTAVPKPSSMNISSLYWGASYQGADRCRVSWRNLSGGEWNGPSQWFSADGPWHGAPLDINGTEYKLECQNERRGWGDHWDTAYQTNTRAVSASLHFNGQSGDNFSVNQGDSFSLSWVSSGATGCELRGAGIWLNSPSNPNSVNNNLSITPDNAFGAYPTSSSDYTNYELLCSNNSNSGGDSLGVRLNQPPPLPETKANVAVSGSCPSGNFSWVMDGSQRGTNNETKTVEVGEAGKSVSLNVDQSCSGYYVSNISNSNGQTGGNPYSVYARPGSPVESFTVNFAQHAQCQFSNSSSPYADPSSISYGGSSNIHWPNSNCQRATISGGRFGGGTSADSGISTGSLTQTTTYRVTLYGQYNEVSKDVTVNVGSPRPTASISASPNPVSYNSPSTLSWSSSHATSCTASGDWSGSKDTSGSQSTGNLTSSKTYTITCTGPGGTSDPASVTVGVGSRPVEQPQCQFNSGSPYAGSNSVSYGGSTNIYWPNSNCQYAVISGGRFGGGQNWHNSGVNTGSLTQQTTIYTVTLYGANNDNTGPRNVTVSAGSPPQQVCTSGPANYTKCSDEGGNCLFNGKANVAYGCNGSYYYKDANNAISCNSSTFGDPAPNTLKACFYQPRSQPKQCEDGIDNDGDGKVDLADAGCGSPSDNNEADDPVQSATISVTNNTSGSWTINPENRRGSGSSSTTVNPSSGGTLYTVSPDNVSGYNYPPAITNTKTGSGSSMMVFPGESVGFGLTYTSAFNYSLSNSGSVTVRKAGVDQFGQNTVTKALTNGSAQSVDLTLSGVPSDVSYSIGNRACSPTCQSSITFTVAPSAPSGTHSITVTGSPLGRTTGFNLVIEDAPNLIVTCTASPSVAQIGQMVVWTANISNGTPPYAYTWSGPGIPTSPAPTSNPYSLTYSTVGLKTAQAVVRDSLLNQGTCTPAGTVQIQFDPTFEEF